MWYGCSVCTTWAWWRWRIQIEDPKQGASAREKAVVVKKEIKQTATVLGWKTFVWILWFLCQLYNDFAVAILGPASTKRAATGSAEGEGKSTSNEGLWKQFLHHPTSHMAFIWNINDWFFAPSGETCEEAGGAKGKGTPAEKQYTDVDFASCDWTASVCSPSRAASTWHLKAVVVKQEPKQVAPVLRSTFEVACIFHWNLESCGASFAMLGQASSQGTATGSAEGEGEGAAKKGNTSILWHLTRAFPRTSYSSTSRLLSKTQSFATSGKTCFKAGSTEREGATVWKRADVDCALVITLNTGRLISLRSLRFVVCALEVELLLPEGGGGEAGASANCICSSLSRWRHPDLLQFPIASPRLSLLKKPSKKHRKTRWVGTGAMFDHVWPCLT